MPIGRAIVDRRPSGICDLVICAAATAIAFEHIVGFDQFDQFLIHNTIRNTDGAAQFN